MFKLAENKLIGKHLETLIERNFDSRRKFGGACIEEATGHPASDEEKNKMSNRLSQIIRGKKSIQITDLPVFTKLLHVSCEELLSAREHPANRGFRYTNYDFALSDSPEYWEDFIHLDDAIILNTDEYGKTVIDYALQFKNYKLLQYLINKQYIWFVDKDDENFVYNFGAGTRISRKDCILRNRLAEELEFQDRLRTDLAALAIENLDFKMLDYLHARETPQMYNDFPVYSLPIMPEEAKLFNENLLNHIIQGKEDVIDYFTKSFSICSSHRSEKFNYIFPYVKELIEKMIERNSRYTPLALKNAIAHNQWAMTALKKAIKETIHAFTPYSHDQERLSRLVQEHFSEKYEQDIFGDYFIYYVPHLETRIFLQTNIVRIEVESADPEINRLIDKLNGIFTDITELKQEKILEEKW